MKIEKQVVLDLLNYFYLEIKGVLLWQKYLKYVLKKKILLNKYK